jgi:CheY-like chemotaxis protein
MKQLLVIEDGSEYCEFARLFLQPDYAIAQATSAASSLAVLTQQAIDVLLIDLRFDRAPTAELIGDVTATAAQLFGGNQGRALRYLQDQQGILILAEVRRRGFRQGAVFVHDFPQRRLANLQQLYGAVSAVPTFDVTAIRRALKEVR